MKLNLRKLAVVVALGGLSIGLIGQGLHAQFSQTAGAVQTLTVGNMQLTLTGSGNIGTVGSSGGASPVAWLNCGNITIKSSSGTSHDVCGGTVRIQYIGDVIPKSLNMGVGIDSNGTTLTDRAELNNIDFGWSAPGLGADHTRLVKLPITAGAPALSATPIAICDNVTTAADCTGQLSFQALKDGIMVTPTLTWGADAKQINGSVTGPLTNASLGKTIQLDDVMFISE